MMLLRARAAPRRKVNAKDERDKILNCGMEIVDTTVLFDGNKI